MVLNVRKILLWVSLFGLSFFVLSLSISSNALLPIACSLIVTFFVYIAIRDCFNFIIELNDRLADYELLYLLSNGLVSSIIEGRRNLISLLEGACRNIQKTLPTALRARGTLRALLYKKLFINENSKLINKVKASSPLTNFILSIIGRLDFADEFSLKNIIVSLHYLSFSIYSNAKKLKELIAVERMKYRVLQTASAMTLGFIVKTFLMFIKFSYTSLSVDLLVVVAFSLFSIVLFVIFSSFVQLRHPSSKELVIPILVLIAFVVLPPYDGV